MMRERNELTLIFPLSPSGFEMWYRTPSKSAHRNRIRHNDVISGPSQTQNVPATVTSMLSGLGLKRNSIKILRVFLEILGVPVEAVEERLLYDTVLYLQQNHGCPRPS